MHNSAPEEDGEDHVAALSGDPAEQRAAPRHTLLIRAAKLIVGEAEYLCVLRDASETGVSLRLFHDLPASPNMLLELQNEDRHEVELVWHAGEKMGLRFRERIDINRMIEMPAPFNRRPIRMRVRIPGVIGVGEDTTMCTICDLSLQGAKVACERSFAIDQRVRLMATGMPKVQAKIRWRRSEQLGLAFENTFQLNELAQIVAASYAAVGPQQLAPALRVS